MSFIDALIPLVIGLLLVARPQAFTKKRGSTPDVVALYRKLRMIGYALLGVGLLFVALAVIRQMAPGA